FAMVSLNGQWGLIDTFGNEILPTEFNSSMVRWAVDSNNINAFDELVSSGALSQFDSIGAINNGLARVRYNSQYGFIDTTGAIVIPVIYAGASDFANGFASVSEYADGRFYHSLIDTAGHTIFEPREYQIFVCESGMFIGHYNPFFGTAHSPRHMQTRNALLDQQGNYLTGFYYERISPFNNGFAIVTMHSLSPRREVGIINSQGTEVVPLIFSDIRFVSGNTYVVRAANDNQIGLLTLSTSVQSQQIRIRVNGEFVYIPHYDQHPVIIDGRVLVPLRAVMEAMGLYVRWYEAEQAIYVGDDSVAAMLRIGSPYLSIDDGPVFYLDVQPQIINNRTMVPVRAIAEAFHMRVEWYPNERIVDINRVEPLVFVHSQPMPIVPIADWPAHLPRYIAGSIEIFDDGFFETYIHEAYFPLQFRAIWYYMCADIAALPRGENQGRRLAGWERHNDMNRMQLMDFVYWADISREDFDAHIERVRAMYISLGIDYNNEWEELPNADIIFSFNQEIARYFFRRE
ncbi:MAG: WG repeat-containing protein, partial [Defluviitaleaceae bacterium]|nr:WG repeat-containing protein [Defluviitaleaceae bacterium]